LAGISYWSRDYDSDLGVLIKMLFADIPDPKAAREALLKDYRRIPFDHAPSYRALLERLRDGELPMVFNCSAGKDRAGTAAALVLSLLGVPRETVVQDYRLTDKVLSGQAEAMKRAASAYGSVSAEIWEILIGTDSDYIHNAFGAIDEKPGSLEAYFHNELHIDAAGIEMIRDRLLE
jgi:protein-tyrosine phosphatase